MNKKYLLIIIAIITTILCSIVVIQNNIKKFDDVLVSQNQFDKIIKQRKKSKKLQIENIKFNNFELFFDKLTSNWYYSIIEDDENFDNPTINYISNKKNTNIAILKEKIDYNLIENNKQLKLVIYDDKNYNVYNIVCTTLPLINISFDGSVENIIKETSTSMNFYLFDNRKDVIQRVVKTQGSIHVRGATTAYFPKKGYRISLITESLGHNKRDNDLSILGMREDEDWILYAGYNDPEKIRNVFSSNLWYDSCATNNSFGLTNGMKYKYVELFFNNEYWGLYAIGFPMDKKQLNIASDINGNYFDYMFKKYSWVESEGDAVKNSVQIIDGYELENSTENNDLAWKSLNNFYYTLNNTKSVKKLYGISDINNNIDYYLFNNFIQCSDNPMGNMLKNVFISLMRSESGYVALYTPWDMDFAFGNRMNSSFLNSVYEYGRSADANQIFTQNVVYKLLELDDKNIKIKMKERYNYLRNNYWSDEAITKAIKEYEKDIYDSGAFDRDIERWPYSNHNDSELKLSVFKQYVLDRLKAMDKYIEDL